MGTHYLICASCQEISPLSAKDLVCKFLIKHTHDEIDRHIIACVTSDYIAIEPEIDIKIAV